MPLVHGLEYTDRIESLFFDYIAKSITLESTGWYLGMGIPSALPSLGLIRMPSSGSIVGFADVAGTLKRANIISWDFPPSANNRIRIGPVSDINGTLAAEQFGELEFYTDVRYTFNGDTAFPQKQFRILENPASGANPPIAFAVAHNGNTPAYIRFGGGIDWTLEPNFVLDQRTYFGILDNNGSSGGVRNLSGGGQDTQVFKVGMGLTGENGTSNSAIRVTTHTDNMASQINFDKAIGIRVDAITRAVGATANITVGIYIPAAAIFGSVANYALWIAAGESRFGGIVKSSVVGDVFLPTTDNQGNIGNVGARWALIRGVVITAGDFKFENGWRLTEAEKLGLPSGVALVKPSGEIANVWN